MNMIDESRTADPAFTNKSKSSKNTILSAFGLRLVLRCPYAAAITVALMFGGAGDVLASHAGEVDLSRIGGGGVWQDASAWATNLYDYGTTNPVTDRGCRPTNYVDEVRTNLSACGAGGTGWYPGQGGNQVYQSAYFTNAGTYTVTLSGSLTTGSNVFANATNTEATVTIDLSGRSIEVHDAYTVANKNGSTTTVYLVNGGHVSIPTSFTVGNHGFGTLILTNMTFDAGGGSANMGNGDSGRGILVVSGPTARLDPLSQIDVGCDPQQAPAGSMMIVTNGAFVLCQSSFRVGSSASKGGTSNNTLIVTAGSILTCDSGPETIGLRSTGITNVDGGTLCFNNVVLVKSGALWACANTSSKSVCIGDFSFFGESQTLTTNVGQVVTGNLVQIDEGGVVTGASTWYIGPTNTLKLLGGYLQASTISNWGTMIAYGTHRGEERIFEGGMLKTLNSMTNFVISNGLWMVTNSILEVELATNYHPIDVFFNGGTNRLTIDRAKLNIVDGGGFVQHPVGSYDLFNYGTIEPPGPPPGWGNLTNALGITNFTGFSQITGPNTPTYTYSIDTNTYGKIKLLVGGIAVPVPFQIISVVRQAGTNIVLTWTGPLNKTNIVESTTGLGNGSYSTNTFAAISGDISSLSTTNSFTDTNGAAATQTRYYRVRQKP